MEKMWNYSGADFQTNKFHTMEFIWIIPFWCTWVKYCGITVEVKYVPHCFQQWNLFDRPHCKIRNMICSVYKETKIYH